MWVVTSHIAQGTRDLLGAHWLRVL
ncbi:hypothetical protein DVH24_001629 [Malus domestica]|uniref:Uncharacterized protein n=1 Tax=Malus domestica TaxID=3750 RepID=A0A498HYZ1_MALDO|nr:hypothetical protein DVH24_001629 [Malus domestica]